MRLREKQRLKNRCVGHAPREGALSQSEEAPGVTRLETRIKEFKIVAGKWTQRPITERK